MAILVHRVPGDMMESSYPRLFVTLIRISGISSRGMMKWSCGDVGRFGRGS